MPQCWPPTLSYHLPTIPTRHCSATGRNISFYRLVLTLFRLGAPRLSSKHELSRASLIGNTHIRTLFQTPPICCLSNKSDLPEHQQVKRRVDKSVYLRSSICAFHSFPYPLTPCLSSPIACRLPHFILDYPKSITTRRGKPSTWTLTDIGFHTMGRSLYAFAQLSTRFGLMKNPTDDTTISYAAVYSGVPSFFGMHSF